MQLKHYYNFNKNTYNFTLKSITTCGILLLYHFTTEIHMVNNQIENFIATFFWKWCEIPLSIPKMMPIMLALCLMLLLTYYAKNYAGIIDSSLVWACWKEKWPSGLTETLSSAKVKINQISRFNHYLKQLLNNTGIL